MLFVKPRLPEANLPLLLMYKLCTAWLIPFYSVLTRTNTYVYIYCFIFRFLLMNGNGILVRTSLAIGSTETLMTPLTGGTRCASSVTSAIWIMMSY